VAKCATNCSTFAAETQGLPNLVSLGLKPLNIHFVYHSKTTIRMEPSGYLPIVLQALVAIGFVAFVLIVVPFLGPRRKSSKKNENFECGIEGQGNARIPVSIKYFMTDILFVLFDVEVIFFYPYAVNFRAMGWEGFSAVLMFVGIFLVGFYYVLLKGALNWEK
jgi:NADH-quinone oxidoreductase subunit A